jgi:hypothetical protein
MLTNIKHSDLIDNSPNGGEEWKVIYSKSRREKKVAEYCFSERIDNNLFVSPCDKYLRMDPEKTAKNELNELPECNHLI